MYGLVGVRTALRTAARTSGRAACVAAAVAAMAACSSVSLKPQPKVPVVVSTPQAVSAAAAAASSPAATTAAWASAWADAASASASMAAAAASATATAQPVVDGTLPEATPLPAAPPPPVSPALAARFPEPDVTFATPAFEPDRVDFTSNDELRRILRGLERNGDGAARGGDVTLLDLGASQAGTLLQALAFTRLPGEGAGTAPGKRPAVVLIAGQHGDQPAGTEALIVMAQDMTAGRYERVLSRVDVFVVPRANPDAAALGRQSASDGTDLDRDHLLLRTPEAQALAKLIRDLAPVVVLDLQEYPVDAGFAAKFGAVQRFDALLDYATVANLPPFVSKAAEEWFRQPLAASLRNAGFSTEWVYRVNADPADRTLAMGGVGAEWARNANGLKNIVSLVVETRGGGIGRGDLKRRVQAGVVAVRSVLTNAAARGGDLLKLRDFVERDVAAKACLGGDMVVEAAPTPSEHVLTMLDPETGAIKRTTVSWDSALELRALKSRPRPCGYWLAPGEFQAAQRLRLLGVAVQQLDESGEMRGEVFREATRPAAAGNAAAAARPRLQTAPALLDVEAGGYYVSLEQPLANLVIAALEPDSPSSFVSGGLIPSVTAAARITARPQMRMSAVP